MSHTHTIANGGHLEGVVRVPGDKSITHRAWIFNALADGVAKISGGLESEDTEATRRALRQLGIRMSSDTVHGGGGALQSPSQPIDCGNSGTTARLLMGALAGTGARATLTGDSSLSARPMGRVAGPLAEMGAEFSGGAKQLPLTMQGACLSNIQFSAPVPSAQVKTALLLAGLKGSGKLTYEEQSCSRDHSERLLRTMGAVFEDTTGEDGVHRIVLEGPQRLSARDVQVPGDISSAAFFLVAATVLPGSDLLIEGVGVNPTRTGILDSLNEMGARIDILRTRDASGEPVADLRVRHASLTGIEIGARDIPRIIDELPVLAVAMAHAAGPSTVYGAGELRVKESDRLAGIVEIVEGLGSTVCHMDDAYRIEGSRATGPTAVRIDASGDHRIAMAALVAGLAGAGQTTVVGVETISSSYPDFISTLEGLRV